jgi:ABC-type branched-subunit amino acid transport system substrate-binding protein
VKKYWLVLIVLCLIALIMPACGGNGENENPTNNPVITATATAVTTPTLTATPTITSTPTPASSEPVKIGAINSWSGAAAISGLTLADPIIKLVEKQVKDRGGVLGGRELTVIRYDSRASVAEAQAGVKKLYYDDKVSVITMGGVSGAEFNAVGAACDELEILFACIAHVTDLPKLKYTVNCTADALQARYDVIKFINTMWKPEKLAVIGSDDATAHIQMPGIKEGVEAAGAKTVYFEYFPLDTSDFSPYLTKIRYEKPDVLSIYSGSNEVFMSIAKQIMELGGWGDIKVITTPSGETAKKLPGAQGWHMYALWAPGVDYPAMAKFQSDYQAMFGREFNPNQIYYYNSLWTAIYAIELAGTDTDRLAIAQAARSGKLEWETPMGHANFMPDGTSGLHYIIEKVQDSAMVYVPMPQ